jgi:magnesium chelatase subunit D
MSFCAFIDHKQAKLSLILNLIDPGIGGVLFVGERGSGKSTLARSIVHLLPGGAAFVTVPLNVTEEMLLGCVNIEEAVRTGNRILERGLISRAQGGVLYIDDVNLLPVDALNLVLDSRNRDGTRMDEIHPKTDRSTGFILIGTMNPDEGFVSAHALDRFGLCCQFDGTSGKSDRLRVARRASARSGEKTRYLRRESRLRSVIDRARLDLPAVTISESIRELIVTTCLTANVAGHRADLTLQRAVAAYAAFCGDAEVLEKHLAKVVPMVLMHRMRSVQETPPQKGKKAQQPQEQEPSNDDRDDGNAEENRNPPEHNEGEDKKPSEKNGPETPEPQRPNKSGRSDEEIFRVGDPFKVRRIVFGKDRKERRASGRRTQTRFAGKGGRYVKSTLRPREHDIAVDATLRAAAPCQRLRGRRCRMIIRDEDLRYKERERKMGHVAIFAVDCSGSMGAKKRMIETKGAILSLLTDCYQKRDKVAMIAFRKDRAELLLPPTSSIELASDRLRDLPVGGKTPLGAGLLETYHLIRRVGNKDPHTRFVVVIISDGRANQGMTDLPVREEVARCAHLLLELANTDYLVVDTEDKSSFMHADLAAELASTLRATYFTTSDLKAEYLAQIVNSNR